MSQEVGDYDRRLNDWAEYAKYWIISELRYLLMYSHYSVPSKQPLKCCERCALYKM